MEKFKFTVGRMYFNSTYGKCICVSTDSKKHLKAPVKLLQVHNEDEDGLEVKEIYLHESGKHMYTHDFPSFIPLDMFDMRFISTIFYAGAKYWIPEMGSVMLCAMDVEKDTMQVIRYDSKSTHTVSLTSSGKIHPDDKYPTILDENPFAQDRFIRHTGKTTRIIDDLIQEFFKNGSVAVKDHHHSQRSDKFIMRKFLDRLCNEHTMTIDVDVVLDIQNNVVHRK